MVSKFIPSLAIIVAQILLLCTTTPISAFSTTLSITSPLKSFHVQQSYNRHLHTLASSPNDDNNLGVIDLTDDDEEEAKSSPAPAAPFLSQGELSDDPNLLSPDLSDAKQTRVIIYIILTLLPVLFLVPLMIGSRDLIPLDALPPVEMN